MEEEHKIEEVQKVGKSTKTVEHDDFDAQDQARVPANKDHFDTLMGPQKKIEPTQKIEPVSQSSLMEEVRNLNNKAQNITKVDPTQLVAQADELFGQIENAKRKLATPSLEIKPATQTLLQNKLSHVSDHLQAALSKAGVEYTPAADHLDNKLVNPIDRFLGFLTHGQEQLKSLSHEVETMHLNNKEISPANMLRIQMKVGYAQQEIEFFTAVLNKALESTKTIFNVQV
jgi:hypothetical protein